MPYDAILTGFGKVVFMEDSTIKEPFAVINSYDFYGCNCFEVLTNELNCYHDRKDDYCMVGFRIGNTMTENGGVNRSLFQTHSVKHYHKFAELHADRQYQGKLF